MRQEPRARLDAYESVFTALAHPARRRILLTMNFEGGAMTAGEIAKVFEHAWPTTTRHLRVLEDAGLLRHERDGRTRRYRLLRTETELAGEMKAAGAATVEELVAKSFTEWPESPVPAVE